MGDGAISENVRRAVEAVMSAGKVPGIVLAVARGQGDPAYLALGSDAAGHPLDRRSLFPVASVTKLATALAVLRLVDAGLLALDDLLRDYLPVAAAAQPGVTLRTLLCHTSGAPIDLAPGAAPYTEGLDWPTLRAVCVATALEAPPDTRVQYSNVGYGLLAAVVEQQTGQDFPVALRDLVLDPLGVAGYLGGEPPRPPATLADIRSEHRGGALEPFNSPFYRSLAMPWGGMVTDVDGALSLVRAFQGLPATFLQEETRAAATSNNAGELPGGQYPPLMWPRFPWGLGPELRGAKTPHWAPPEASPESFGHAGASGCLAWADPRAGVAWALLGARTADSGWLIRRAPAIGAAILAEARGGT